MSVQTVDEIALKIKVQDDGSWVVENLQEKIKKSTKDMSQHFGTANKSLASWMKNMAKATGIFHGFYGVIRGGVNIVKGLISDTENFDTELTQVATLVDTTQVDIDKMSDSLFNMAGAMGSVGELTQGTYMEISSSVPAKNALNELTEAAIFAAGGQADLSDSVNLGTTSLNTYGEAAGGTKHVFDVLWQVIKDGKTTARELAAYMGQGIPIFKEAGMSFEDAGASLAVMTQISGNTSISVTALRGIISEVIKPSQEAAKEAERIGANFSVAAIKSMGFEGWLRHLLDAVQKNNGDMATLFGRVEALNGIYQLTRNNLANFTDEMQKMSNVTGNNQEAYEKYLQSFQGSWNEVKNKLQALFIQVILPLMKEFANWLRENSDSIMGFARNVIAGVKTIISIISQFKDIIIIAGKVWLANFAIQKVQPFFTVMSKGIGTLKEFGNAFIGLQRYGMGFFDSLKGAYRTATGDLTKFSDVMKKIPTSLKISVALVGAELAANLLGNLLSKISKLYDEQMYLIQKSASEIEGEAHKITKELINFRGAGEEYEIAFQKARKEVQKYINENDNVLVRQQKLKMWLEKLYPEWQKYQDSLKKAANVTNSVQMETNKHNEILEKSNEKIRNLCSEIGLLSNQKIIELQNETGIYTRLVTENAGQLEVNQVALQNVKTKVDEIAAAYRNAGQEVPPELQKLITMVAILGWSFGGLGEEVKFNQEVIHATTPDIDLMAESMAAAKEMTMSLDEYLEYLAKDLHQLSGLILQATDFLSEFGFIGEDTADMLSQVGKGIGSIAGGLESITKGGANFFDYVSGGISLLSGFGSIAKGILDGIAGLFKGDGVGEAIDRERQNIDISESMEKIIRETEEAIGDTHAAISRHFKEIVQEAEITVNNISNYWQRARDILADLDRGTLSAQEAATSIGESFNALLTEAQRLGTEGSKEMLALIGDVRNRGLEVAEITEYINSKLMGNIDAIGNYISTFKDIGAIKGELEALNNELANGNLTGREAAEIQQQLILKQDELSSAIQDVAANWDFVQAGTLSTFHALEAQGFSFFDICKMMGSQLNWIAQTAKQSGLEVSEGLKAMTNMADFINQNQELTQRIESTRQMMEGLANTDFFNETDFNMFLTQTKNQYQEILALTGDEEMALRLISPILQDIIKYSGSYNLSIDEETQAIINLAAEHKVLGQEEKSHYEITNEILLAIAEALGAKIPEGLRECVRATRESVGDMTGEFGKLQGSIGNTVGDIDRVSRSMVSLDDVTKNVISGNTIILEWEKWRKTISETDTDIASIPKTMRMLDTEFTDSSVYLQTIFAEFQRQTLAWQEQIKAVEAEMATASRSQMPELETRYNDIMNGMAADTMMFKDYLLEVANKIGFEIPSDLNSLSDIYTAVMAQMANQTDTYLTSAEGVVLTLDQIIRKQSVAMSQESGFGSSYGVYTQEEKVQKTSEFLATLRQWNENREIILGDEQFFSSFANRIKNFKGAITDEYLEEFNKWLGWIPKIAAKLKAGYTWNEDNREWMAPTSAASGIQFIVPPGYEQEEKGYPMMVHSGELVQVYTRYETQRILNREFTPDFSVSIPEPQKQRNLNDGFAPYFVPQIQTINKNDFKFNLTSPIEINLKSETKLDNDELEKLVLELVDDEYRGFGTRLAERVERRLQK